MAALANPLGNAPLQTLRKNAGIELLDLVVGEFQASVLDVEVEDTIGTRVSGIIKRALSYATEDVSGTHDKDGLYSSDTAWLLSPESFGDAIGSMIPIAKKKTQAVEGCGDKCRSMGSGDT